MGTSGNNPGYKVFSISTTIRNPRRNGQFLEVLQKFDGQELTGAVKDEIYYELVKHGIYQFVKLDNLVKEKYKNGEELEDEEIRRLIAENPQKTGNDGRVMTQVRALKDTGLVSLDGGRNHQVLRITKLGWALLQGENIENVYTKAMLGLHAHNPGRPTIYNRARPFLNTLFVIKTINDFYGNQKGILWHEFAVFVLSMIDCDYQRAAEEIIQYRARFGNKLDIPYLERYLYDVVGVNRVKIESILKDYADDVYRKFEMTGLIVASGFNKNIYVRFNQFNLEKVKALLAEYADYEFEDFLDTESYNDYLAQINLPWEVSEQVKRQIIQAKQAELNIEVNTAESLDRQMARLDRVYAQKLFSRSVVGFSQELLEKELKILAKSCDGKSQFDGVPEPVRLEWMIALLVAKVYGAKYVKPNLTLDETGIPKAFAAGGLADIEFVTEKLYCLIEVTLQRDYHQQLNSETTSISDHLRQVEDGRVKCSLMIAPRVHQRVIKFFQFTTMEDGAMIVGMTIDYFLKLVREQKKPDDFAEAIQLLSNQMCGDDQKYCDMMNGTR